MHEATSSQGTAPQRDDPPSSLPLLEPGEQVAGRFEIVERLGKGGMAVVYRARPVGLGAQRGLPDEVALKAVAVPDGRFLREARLGAVLRHPNICEILEYGQDWRGFGYIVMPLLRGETFEEYLSRGARPFSELRPYFVQILQALEAASNAGIVHRDIKPANIVLDTSSGEPTVKILDFGLSKWRAIGGESTASDEVFGTPYYMSPEQVRSTRQADVRTDLWSVGVMLYESVTGRKPFQGSTAHEVFTAILSKQPPRPSLIKPDVPRALEKVIQCAMESDREDRFATPAQMLAALEAAATGNEGEFLAPWNVLGIAPRKAHATRGERLLDRLKTFESRFGGTADPRRRLIYWLSGFSVVAIVVASGVGVPGMLAPAVDPAIAMLALPCAMSSLTLGVLSFLLYVRSSARDARNGRRPGLAAAEAISVIHSPYLWLGAVAFGLADALGSIESLASTGSASAVLWTGACAYACSAALHAWLAGRAGSPRPPWPDAATAPSGASIVTLVFLALLLSAYTASIATIGFSWRGHFSKLDLAGGAELYWKVASTSLLAWGLQVVGAMTAFVVAYGKRAMTGLGVDPACGPAGTAAAIAFSELLEDELRVADGVAGFLILCAVASDKQALLWLIPVAVPGLHLLLSVLHLRRTRSWLTRGPGLVILDEGQKQMFVARCVDSLPLVLFTVVARREMILVALCLMVALLSFLL